MSKYFVKLGIGDIAESEFWAVNKALRPIFRWRVLALPRAEARQGGWAVYGQEALPCGRVFS